MLAAGPGVWSFVQCTLAWFEGPLLGAARIFIWFKRIFLHLQDSVTRPSFTGWGIFTQANSRVLIQCPYVVPESERECGLGRQGSNLSFAKSLCHFRSSMWALVTWQKLQGSEFCFGVWLGGDLRETDSMGDYSEDTGAGHAFRWRWFRSMHGSCFGVGKPMVPTLLLHWVVLSSYTATARGSTPPATLSTCNERENI